MSLSVSIIGFFGIMVFGLAAYFFVSSGLYPVAVVNFNFITAIDMQKDYAAALKYFENAAMTYGSNVDEKTILESDNSKKEVKRATLEKLINDFLIYSEAKKKFGNDLDAITDKVIRENVDLSKLEKPVEQLYGMKLEDFKARILASEARKEILEGRMFTEKQNFNDWLKAEKDKASVFILVSGFDWNGEGVIIKP